VSEIQLGHAIDRLAAAINRLAATQEKPKLKGAVSYSQAHYEDQPDAQTESLREIAKSRHEESGG